MKTKITTLLFGLVLTPCISLAGGAPSIASDFQQQLNTIQQQLVTLVNTSAVCPAGAPTRFVDNGDGTICDHQTGLMWEQKNGDDEAFAEDRQNPHDVDNKYTWSSTGKDPDGTVFTEFLPMLNGVIARSTASEQLGGYSDWRLPTSAEAQSIVTDCDLGRDEGRCTDIIFLPVSQDYWSATSTAGSGSLDAYYTQYFNGFTGHKGKQLGNKVRAVRDGR